MRHAIPFLIGVTFAAGAVMSPVAAMADDIMMFTANQEFLSRIYLLDTAGTVTDHHQYDFYRWVGMEVVNGELYVAEAFAPRVYKVDPVTGDLEVFIDDWTLYYFYDVAFDGEYFWSAESGDSPGWIFKFDHSGKVIQQWPEPALSGWGEAIIKDPATGISMEQVSPDVASGLVCNYPNPFNPITNIRFILPVAGFAELSVYDAAGMKIQTLLSSSLEAGAHEVPWRAGGLASGIYWAKLGSGGRIATHKMVLLK